MFLRFAYFHDDSEQGTPEEIDHEKLVPLVPDDDKVYLTVKNLQEIVGKTFADALMSQMRSNTIPALKDPTLPGIFSVKCLFTQEDYDVLMMFGHDEFCKVLFKFYDRLAFDEETGELYDIDENEPASYLWYMYTIKVNPNDITV